MIPSEHDEQVAVVKFLTENNIDFYAIPNGGLRNKITGAILKREGVKAGVPDLHILGARHGYSGLFLEMKKRSGGAVSPEQKNWLKIILPKHKFFTAVCFGAAEAILTIRWYFELQ